MRRLGAAGMKHVLPALQTVRKPVQLVSRLVDRESAVKLLSIGTVSEACGIPIDTLRTWERRYHFPAPQRTSGGQRLYSPDTVDRLLALKRAMANGLQVSRAVQLVMSTGEEAPAPVPAGARSLANESYEAPSAQHWLNRWLHLVATLDGDALDQLFRRDHGLMGTMRFLNERCGPFLEALGEEWAAGRLTVANEHFAAERFREFMVRVWGPIAAENTGPLVLCATMPGEHHQLGLHMAAATVALAGLRVLFLGANMPPQDTAQAVRMAGAVAVVISISRVIEPPTVRRQLYELRLAVGDDVTIVAGGRGAPANYDTINTPGSLDGLAAWATDLFNS